MRNLIFFIILLFVSCQRGEVGVYESYLNHHDTISYIGKETCKQCHLDIYNSFIETGMGQSMRTAIRSHSSISDNDILIYDEYTRLFYKPFWKSDSLWLHEFQLSGNDTTHSLKRKVNYIIGSGHHTNSHLFEENGYLHQMPFTYYTQDSIADLPPGYEDGYNTRFSRKIGLECMSCHNAYGSHVDGSANKYNIVEDGIDCERCHGPGEAHLKQIQSGKLVDTSKFIDYSIVNPSKLSLDLQFDICQRCHLQGTAVLAEGKTFLDFKPGKHLSEVMDIYRPKYYGDESFIMASHVERLKESKCFEAGDMSCITCHNPHKSVRTTNTIYFDNKCMNCHDLCKDEDNIDNCASCHMPVSSSTDIPHVSITDHKIAIHKESGNKEKGKFLGLYSINNPSPTNISRAKAYLKQYESFEPLQIYLDSAFSYLQKTSIDKSFPFYIQYYYLKQDYNSIIDLALQYIDERYYGDTRSVQALCLSRIAESFAFNNFDQNALSMYHKAIKAMPYELDYQLKLSVHLIKIKDYTYAENILNNIIDEYQYHKEALVNMGYLYIMKKEYSIADVYLQRAIDTDPNYIKAYENKALLYYTQGNIDVSKKYLNKILEIAPDNNKARVLLNQF